MLGAAEQDVAAHKPFHPGLEAPALAQKNYRSAIFRTATHEGGGHQHVHEADDGSQVMEQSTKLNFALYLYEECLVIQVNIGTLGQLLRHPEHYRALIEDPGKIPAAVEEMLRWVTPIQNMSRTATRDVGLHGERIRKGDKVLLLYPSANRDEAIFEDPFCFDIARNPNPHVAFGGYGSHFCLGASLARLELTTMIQEIVTELPLLELATADPLPMRPSNFIVGIEQMPVRVAA